MWRQGRLTYLDTLGGDSAAYGVNDRGQIIGTSSRADGTAPHPVMWHRGTVVDLTDHGIDPDSLAVAVNNRAHFVGGLNGHAALFH